MNDMVLIRLIENVNMSERNNCDTHSFIYETKSLSSACKSNFSTFLASFIWKYCLKNVDGCRKWKELIRFKRRNLWKMVWWFGSYKRISLTHFTLEKATFFWLLSFSVYVLILCDAGSPNLEYRLADLRIWMWTDTIKSVAIPHSHRNGSVR